jgi:hypothetical protein
VIDREVHTVEPLVPGPTHPDDETAAAKLKTHKSPGSDQILAKLIQSEGEILLSSTNSLE